MRRKETKESLKELVRTASETGDWTPVEQADVSGVTDMSGMFYCIQCENLDLSGWDTSNVTNMSRMFQCSKMEHPSIGKLNTSKVITMDGMFEASYYNKPIYFDTSNVIDMSDMFCESLFAKSLPESFDTSNVTNMEGMFYGSCYNYPLPNNFITSKVTNMNSMFAHSMFNKRLDMFDTSCVKDMSQMFRNSCFNQPIEHFDLCSLIDIEHIFLKSDFMQDISSWSRSSENVDGWEEIETYKRNYTEYYVHINNFLTGKAIPDNVSLISLFEQMEKEGREAILKEMKYKISLGSSNNNENQTHPANRPRM